MAHRITLLEKEPVTHDTWHLVFERPAGFTFRPGQATDMALDLEGIEEERRPFTFTSAPDAERLEFVIKSYPDHEGVTARLPDLRPGDTARIGAAWGAIEDRGPGVFIAGGAGITPFIPILREQAQREETGRCLVFANKTEADIILREEWDGMAGLETLFVTDAEGDGFPDGPVDEELLAPLVAEGRLFYFCGPPPMAEAVTEALASLGVGEERIVTEDKPADEERARMFEET
ncbi:FAD-binding oxidoreductase [Histidinibacterium lentulum]|uniref:Flavodoxin reductase n=1 Tax=Histidinibacterium lentulum TaxID=2480588 RepID=A0A3N2R8S1_9RHOB|nr:FAD-binding oxidoreductase [Histidinibacterium lentulum]ROU03781.1 flavodoxin reductase [Histidinibacterium lentulum]